MWRMLLIMKAHRDGADDEREEQEQHIKEDRKKRTPRYDTVLTVIIVEYHEP